MWTHEEMANLSLALTQHGTSITAITRELENSNSSRSSKQILQKLINMKKWPQGYDPEVIKIISEGRLSIKT